MVVINAKKRKPKISHKKMNTFDIRKRKDVAGSISDTEIIPFPKNRSPSERAFHIKVTQRKKPININEPASPKIT